MPSSDAELQQVAPAVAPAQPLEATAAGSAGEQAGDTGDDTGYAAFELVAQRDGDVPAERNLGAVKRAQRAYRHQPGAGDGRAGMAGQSDSIGKAVFDQAPFCCAEQFGQRVTQRDGGDTREEFGKGHVDLLSLQYARPVTAWL